MSKISFHELLYKYFSNENIQADSKHHQLSRLLDRREIIEKLNANVWHTIDSAFESRGYSMQQKFFHDLKKTFKPKGMNPNKDYIATNFFIDNKIIVDLKNWIDNNVINEGQFKVALQVGSKGSGKTLTQNVFFHRYENYLRENNVFWVRCDIQKLFDIWQVEKNAKIDKLLTIEEYLNLQLLYVFAKYHIANSMFNQFSQKLRLDGTRFEIRHDYEGRDRRPVGAFDWILHVHGDIEQFEKRAGAETASYMIEEIVLNSRTSYKKRAFNQWIEFSKDLQLFLKTEGVKFLFVVDGIDNLNLSTNRSLSLYQQILDEYAKFTMHAPKDNYFFLTSLRNRTFNELKLRNTHSHYAIGRIGHDEIKQLHQEESDVILLGNAFKKRIEFAFSEIDKAVTKSKIEDAEHLEAIRAICNIIADEELDTQTDAFFHKNCRNYLYNKLNTLKFVYYRWVSDRSRNNYPFEDVYSRLKDQATILNGHLYLNSETKLSFNTDDGFYTVNLFYIPSQFHGNSSSQIWQGLCAIRILQYMMKGYRKNPSIQEIKRYFEKYFQYDQKLIDFQLERMREFGLIDSEYYESHSDEPTVVFNVSRKGNYVYSKTFNALEWLYYFSLDTPIPENTINSFGFSSHNLNHEETEYHYNCVRNAVLFIKFLLIVESEEIKQLKFHLEGEFKEEVYKSTFSLQPALSEYNTFYAKYKKLIKPASRNKLIKELSI